ncbi:hypothetical protein L484_024343 [Morus notabilis]|uniref:Uncharacterized protein n=1 Tax=Morus notabilis TaxID=981085 RepID=W9RWX5_9ROSA|nr:uncharacterized protein LOC21407088 [Morus notabilis]XP_024028736.1 uncharacterized protein LOC21407088 [Morus notabilis]XP_024028737.1 uncharacterized protein LOC21407088 [Morus notabilis]EXC16175.1 hypothetical protein L484_024343 [Morus notabilis]
MHGECQDMNQGTTKTSQIQSEKTSESQAKTSHDVRAAKTSKNQARTGNLIDFQADQKTNQARTCKDVQAEVLRKDFLGVTKDEELLKELEEKNDTEKAREEEEEERSSRAKIQRVMHYLLQNNDKIIKHFAPREISVGLLRAGNSKLCKKELKLKLAKTFIKRGGQTPVRFLTEIMSNIPELKTHFSKGVIPDGYNDDSLARLLFLDGCAVLQFIHSYVWDELEEFKINTTQAAFIQQDLFLFENQIPFKVLTLLMGVMHMDTTDEEWAMPSLYKASIIQFVHENNICAPSNAFNYYRRRWYRQMIGILDQIKPLHLLDLLRKVSIFGSIKNVEDESDARKFLSDVFDQPKNCLLSLANCFSEKWSYIADKLEKRECIEQRSLRSVQELKSSGITMKLSNSRSLKSVSFATHCLGIFGHLKLPALNVNDSTVRKLLNLVAYETCLDDSERCYSVTSYLNFLDLLIDTEQDVKDLRTARILRNALGSDAEVAKLFNTLGLTYLPKSNEDHFERIHTKIEEHYAKKCKIKMAQIYASYLRNPWPTLGFFLAPTALLLTVVQTWYAINPRR